MPTKTCNSCGQESHVRTKVCKCGTAFVKKSVVLENVISDIPEKEPEPQVEVVKPVRLKRCTISTPSEVCPFAPQGFKYGKWEHAPTDEEIQDWARKVANSSSEVTYLPSAVVYWARSFWEIHDNDWYRVRGLIYSAFETD